MEKYSDVKEFIDNYKEKIADDFDNIEDYYLILRIDQMYRELEQVKLSYKKVLEQDFKETLLRQAFQARQNLYNTKSCNPRKRDLIDGINYAIEDLNKILVLQEVQNDTCEFW